MTADLYENVKQEIGKTAWEWKIPGTKWQRRVEATP